MNKIEDFYLNYLGVNAQELASGERVFSSDLRGKPESELTCNVHDLIVSVFNDNLIHSVNEDMLKSYCHLAPRQVSTDLLELVDDAFFKVCKYRYYWISEWFRYSTDESHDLTQDVTVLTSSHREMIEARKQVRRGHLFRDRVWEKAYFPLLLEGRLMAVIRDSKIVSYSSVTYMPFGAANIAVWTDQEHRKMGYGANCVMQAVNWCKDNNRIPIYLVSTLNIASIRLAEKLGFNRFASEIRTTVNTSLNR
ncbi:MAG: GNAT family N-acetyltransferase [Candidatus Sabulitectum sp.]|nr:GNAT family N-acetyltransferase [Candidatus Sabulitectum sp.]